MSKSIVLSNIQQFIKTTESIIYPKTTTYFWLRTLIVIAILLLILRDSGIF